MTLKKPYVRRITLKDWSWNDGDLLGVLLVFGRIFFSRPNMMWQFLLRNALSEPENLGLVTMSNGVFTLWLFKGHMWISDHLATSADVKAKGMNIKTRYDAKQQWWWGFTDPSLRHMMESMDHTIFGLKQNHEKVWKGLSLKHRKSTSSTATTIGVRDNRHIPQWVKLHVTLRDKGQCVYCGEKDLKLLEFDHRHAWSKGGSSKDPLNICLGCKTCNRSKGARNWGWG